MESIRVVYTLHEFTHLARRFVFGRQVVYHYMNSQYPCFKDFGFLQLSSPVNAAFRFFGSVGKQDMRYDFKQCSEPEHLQPIARDGFSTVPISFQPTQLHRHSSTKARQVRFAICPTRCYQARASAFDFPIFLTGQLPFKKKGRT